MKCLVTDGHFTFHDPTLIAEEKSVVPFLSIEAKYELRGETRVIGIGSKKDGWSTETRNNLRALYASVSRDLEQELGFSTPAEEKSNPSEFIIRLHNKEQQES